jgi:AraC-like DNA-binding protein
MLFESDGTTFSRFLLDQRLARAHRMLSNPVLAERTISTIAYEAGFGDLSHFNRAFRRRYGAAPSDVGVVKVTPICRCVARYAHAQSMIYAARARHSANAAVRLCLYTCRVTRCRS